MSPGIFGKLPTYLQDYSEMMGVFNKFPRYTPVIGQFKSDFLSSRVGYQVVATTLLLELFAAAPGREVLAVGPESICNRFSIMHRRGHRQYPWEVSKRTGTNLREDIIKSIIVE